ncbi:hypothetical protein BDEG_21841 [Batrachochytrium dendrobatidis JEL423]|nr:hypothetical protein BDEG_21841 [Batrachochytrium dendrobatidis JEL423]
MANLCLKSFFSREMSTRICRIRPAVECGINYSHNLYVADVNDPDKVALTFTLPNQAHSTLSDEDIIGWVDRSVFSKNLHLNTESSAISSIKPFNFTSNHQFESRLHKFLAENIHKDEAAQALANYQKEGHLNINDERVFTPWGRVSDPEDILGNVLVQNGKIVKGSYQRMPTHRLFSLNGLFQLNKSLHDLYIQK